MGGRGALAARSEEAHAPLARHPQDFAFPMTSAPPSRARRWIRRGASVLSLAAGLAAACFLLHVYRAESPVEPAPISNGPVPAGASLRVLAYNVQLLPGLADAVAARVGEAAYRAGRIGEIAAAYDVVGLCEVFDTDRRADLIVAVERAAPGRFAIVRAPKPSGYVTGSGLLLLSRLPVEQWHLHTFEHAARFAEFGLRADGFAAKGILHARLRHGSGIRIDCFVTHLDSKSDPARARQVEAVARFVAEHTTPEAPALLLGDFNVNADVPPVPLPAEPATPYVGMLRVLSGSGRVFSDAWTVLEDGPGVTNDPTGSRKGTRKDYVFVSAGKCLFAPAKIRVLPHLDERVPGGSLSDHAAVECEIRLDPGSDGAGS